jgi:hypothetical protein
MSKMSTRKTMCATCPFREGSPHSNLRSMLEISALSESSRLCHSTGVNALYRTNKPEQLCRGSRDLQLRVMHGFGVIDAPTDEAWDAKCVELGLPTPEDDEHEKSKTRRTRTRSKT